MDAGSSSSVLSELYMWLVVIVLLVGVLFGQMGIMTKFMKTEVKQ